MPTQANSTARENRRWARSERLEFRSVKKLRQLQARWRATAEAARVVYLSLDDDRLSDLPLEQLGLLLVLNFDQMSVNVPAGVTVQTAYQWLLDAA